MQQIQNVTEGIIISSWDEVRKNPEVFSSFLAACTQKFGDKTPFIIYSAHKTAAFTTFLRDHFPLSFLTDCTTMSPARLQRLTTQQYGWDGNQLVLTQKPSHELRPAQKPVLGLVVSNGFGLGHVTRTARMRLGLENYAQAVFSFSGGLWQGDEIFYAPSAQYLELSNDDVHAYTYECMRRFIERSRPTHILYDGNVLPTGMLACLADNPAIHLTWVRRGMWQKDINPKFMAQQAYADLVIEPGDISDSFDTGPTWNARLSYCPPISFLKTPPVKPVMLDTAPLTKEQAMQELGLNNGQRYVLLMLGASQKVEDVSFLHKVLAAVRTVPDLQPVIAHWPIAHEKPPVIEGVKVIERMPLAQFYPAFDLILSAAGYNSFHELLACGAPTVFLPQEDAGRDQQLARANYAAQHGYAAVCRRTDVEANLSTHIQQVLAGGSAGHPKDFTWLTDWQSVADAMHLPKQDKQPQTAALDTGTNNSAKRIGRIYTAWKKRTTKTYARTLVLALDIDAKNFDNCMKKNKKLNTKNCLILTNSIPPIHLRRLGYKYVWLNRAVAENDWALRRQMLNWLKIWRPSALLSLKN